MVYDIVGIIKEDTIGSKIYTKEEIEYLDAYKRLKYILFSYYEIYNYYSNLKEEGKSQQEKNWRLSQVISDYNSFDYTLGDKKINDFVTMISKSSISPIFKKFDKLTESIRKNESLVYTREQLIEETKEIYREIKENAFLYLNLLQYILIKTMPDNLFITKLSKHITDYYIRSDILNEKNHLLIHSHPKSFFDFNFLVYFDLYQSIKEEIEVEYFNKIFILGFEYNITSELINDKLEWKSSIEANKSNITELSPKKTVFLLSNASDYHSFIFMLLNQLYKITEDRESIIISRVTEAEKLMESDSLDDLEQARAILETIRDKTDSGRLCRILGIPNSKLSDYDVAENYFKEAISLCL